MEGQAVQGPLQTLEFIKQKLIYKPSHVSYRYSYIPRKQMIQMRRTLIDKCEEAINSNTWPHGSGDLRTGKIFKDLLQFYKIDRSIFADREDLTAPSQEILMPNISPRLNQSIDTSTV